MSKTRRRETMARPRKCRKVCCLPNSDLFGPLSTNASNAETVIMTVEEYETIRLIDFSDLTQEACSERMAVARTTVQKIYGDARKKIAEALINGSTLKIEGGDYTLCNDEGPFCGCSRCHKNKTIGGTLDENCTTHTPGSD
jgi:predicted DNA-binding protein (UPF0251 family)